MLRFLRTEADELRCQKGQGYNKEGTLALLDNRRWWDPA